MRFVEAFDKKVQKVPLHRKLAFQFYQELEKLAEQYQDYRHINTHTMVHHSKVPFDKDHPRADEYCSRVDFDAWFNTPSSETDALEREVMRIYDERYSGDSFIPVESRVIRSRKPGGGFGLMFEFWPINERNPWKKLKEAKGDLLKQLAERLLYRFNHFLDDKYTEKALLVPFRVKLRAADGQTIFTAHFDPSLGVKSRADLTWLMREVQKYNQNNVLQLKLREHTNTPSTWSASLEFVE